MGIDVNKDLVRILNIIIYLYQNLCINNALILIIYSLRFGLIVFSGNMCTVSSRSILDHKKDLIGHNFRILRNNLPGRWYYISVSLKK